MKESRSRFCEEDAHTSYKENTSFRDVKEDENDDDFDCDYDDDDESEEVDHNDSSSTSDISSPKNGSTSSNSTVEETSTTDHKKAVTGSSVRPYVRSKNPRLRWTPDLHLRFLQAIERLGGQERATPKLVLQLMNVKGLSISHVKSHLQMYRSKKIDDDPNQEGLVSEGDDNHIFHLSQLPMLQSYNQRPLSNFRYQDGSWSQQANCLNYNSFMAGLRHNGIYGSMADRIILARNHIKHNAHRSSLINQNDTPWKRILISNHKEESQMGLFKNFENESLLQDHIQRIKSHMDTNLTVLKDQEKAKRVLKRKETSDQEPELLDLNLSLKIKIPKEDLITNRSKKIKDEIDENSLSLSLFSPSSSISNYSSTRSKHAKTTMGHSSASLDLTL